MQHEEKNHSLWFVVRGQRPCPLQVVVKSRYNIDELKEAIREKGFQKLSGTQMILWKLIKPIPLTLDTQPDEMDFFKKINNIKIPDLDSDDLPERTSVLQLRNVSRKVSDWWANKPQPGCLHLIVQVLALERPKKRQRLESEEHDNDSVDDSQGHTPTSRGIAESEEPTSTPEPPRRSTRHRVMTPKAQVSANRKETVRSSKGEMKDVKHREIDNRAQAYWIVRCNRCEVKEVDCFGPPFSGGDLNTNSERCQRCTSDKQKCRGGVPHNTKSADKSEPDQDSPRSCGKKRLIANTSVDASSPSKVMRISKPSIVPRGGLVVSTGSSSRAIDTTSFLPPRIDLSSAGPSILDWSRDNADDSVLGRLDGLEAIIRRTHDDLLNRIGFIRQDYRRSQTIAEEMSIDQY